MPLLYKTDDPLMGIWKMTESWQELLAAFPDQTVACEVDTIQSAKRKQEWLAIRLLLNELLPHPESPPGRMATIAYHPNGAPYLRDTPCHISLTHTTGYAAVILSQHPHPGIDIEYHSDRAWKLRNKFLGQQEQEFFTQLSDKQLNNKTGVLQKSAFATVCWCAKETVYKSLQQDSVDFMEHLHIQPFHLSKEGILQLKETKTPQQKMYNIHYQTTNEYILTWYIH